MKKSLALSAMLLTLFVSPAFAQKGHGPDKDNLPQQAQKGIEKASENSPVFEEEEQADITLSPSPAEENPEQLDECDAEREWVNHGEYVSCVAHAQHGTAVSDAARSVVGKKKDLDVSDDPTLSPSVSQSPSPSVSVTPITTTSPTITTSPSPSPSIEVSPSPTEEAEQNEVDTQSLVEEIQDLIGSLQDLLDTFLPRE